MVNRNIILVTIGLTALAFSLGQQVSARDTRAPGHTIDAITVNLDPALGRSTQRVGQVASDQAKKGYALVGTVPCQQQINGGVTDTVILIFEK